MGSVLSASDQSQLIPATLRLLQMAKAMRAAMRAAMRRAMKAKKPVSARLAKRHAFFGKITKTATGLKKTDFMKNKAGRIVSKKRSAPGEEELVDRGLQQGTCVPEDQGLHRA